QMSNANSLYGLLLDNLLRFGTRVEARNGPCLRLCRPKYAAYEFDSTPLVSTRKTAWKNSLREWEWFMSGSAHIDSLHPDVRSWWEPWTDKREEAWLRGNV